MIGVDIRKAEQDFHAEQVEGFPEIIKKNFVVENENVVGKSIEQLRFRQMTKAVISRIMRDDIAETPTPGSVLQRGDIIKAVGTESALEQVKLLIGPETGIEIPLSNKYEVSFILVTNKEVVNKTIAQMNLLNTYNATITRIRRSGIIISPTPDYKIQFADKLMIAGSKESLEQVSKIFGNDDRKLSDTDFFPIALGIIIGILVGKIGFNFGSFYFNLGLTGGILFAALILGRIGKTGPIMWTMTGAANQLLRQLGLLFFLAAVGSSAGAKMVETFQTYGFGLFAIGAVITLLPMVIATVVARLFLKMNVLSLLGTLTGGMTSTPGLAAVDSMTDTNAASIAYATVYPIAMVLLIVVVQILSLL